MKPRFKARHMQECYEGYLRAAEAKASELFTDGQPRMHGAKTRIMFWFGAGKYPHPKMVPAKNTLAYACYAAGKEYAKRNPS